MQEEDFFEPAAYRRRSLSDLIDLPDSGEKPAPRPARRKEHVAKLTWRGLGNLSRVSGSPKLLHQNVIISITYSYFKKISNLHFKESVIKVDTMP